MTKDTNKLVKQYNEALHSLILNEPIDSQEVIDLLTDSNGIFVVDEGLLHDYKDEYPFSSSDSYFGGILRLICAFHNSYGGVIIFGVHDKTRSGGKNKVFVDSEKINRKLREDLSSPLEIRTIRSSTASGDVDLVIVPPRPAMVPPLYSTRTIGEYKAKTIYLRRGAEVLTAKGSDLSFLYGDRITSFGNRETTDLSVPSSLPPSPATIQEFVGRFAAIERVIKWMKESRDPRLFLWGQGGSGKSTIAYECATLLAEAGGSLTNKQGHRLDRVLYISGKATLLDPNTGKIQNTSERDFENAEDLYRAILLLSNWTSADDIERYKPDELLDALDELFELESQLIVVDDIDTLTTSKKDAGMEELLLALSRSRSGTKVLYTQRGFPSFAPNASVEVPGLTDEEFQEFVLLCCSKFNVPLPTTEDFEHIKLHSERRPLAIETMMGMRRVTSSYADAFRRWKENSSEARQYLFNREYQQLGTDDRARHLLAALAIFDGPQSAETLRSVLQFSPEQLEDAIAETRDMFLAVAPGDGSRGDLFSLGAATRLYLRETSKQLDRYSSIEARVRHFQNSSKTTPEAFIPIIERASRNLRAGHPNDAIALLSNKDLPAAFKEHTEVQALLGEAYATLAPPNVADARRCFESAFSLGHRHYKMYLEWLEMERKNRTEVSNGIAICSKVIRSNGFNLKTKAAFQKKMAMYQSMKANDIEMTSPLESALLRKEAVLNTIEAYFTVKNARDKELPAYKDRAETALSSVLRRLAKGDDIDGFFDFIESLLSLNQSLDDFQPIISSRIAEFRPHELGSKRPMQARLSRLNGKINYSGSSAFSKNNLKMLSDRIKSSIQVL